MDHFSLFDLTPSIHVDQNDLKQRYYRLSMQHHPDRIHTPEATVRTSEINNAYRTLSDRTLRIAYILMSLEQEDAMKASPDMDFLMEMMTLNEALELTRQDPQSQVKYRQMINIRIEAVYSSIDDLPKDDPRSWPDESVHRLVTSYKELKYLLRMQDNLNNFADASL